MNRVLVRRARSPGFTLLEMVLVVAIIALAMSLAAPQFIRPQQRKKVDATAHLLRNKIEHVRLLASEVAPYIGNVDPTAPAGWNYNPPCQIAPTGGGLGGPGYLWVYLDSTGQVVFPTEVYVDNNGVVNVSCESKTLQELAADANGVSHTMLSTAFVPNVLSPSGGAVWYFSFTGTGRVVYGNSPRPDLLVLFQTSTQENRKFGFRVLPSGVVCTAVDPTTPGTCDSD